MLSVFVVKYSVVGILLLSVMNVCLGVMLSGWLSVSVVMILVGVVWLK